MMTLRNSEPTTMTLRYQYVSFQLGTKGGDKFMYIILLKWPSSPATVKTILITLPSSPANEFQTRRHRSFKVFPKNPISIQSDKLRGSVPSHTPVSIGITYRYYIASSPDDILKLVALRRGGVRTT